MITKTTKNIEFYKGFTISAERNKKGVLVYAHKGRIKYASTFVSPDITEHSINVVKSAVDSFVR